MENIGIVPSEINYWYSFTTDFYSSVADIIVINHSTNLIDKPLIFCRYPSFCFIEPILDSAMKFTKSIEYMDTINILTRNFQHLRTETPQGLLHDKEFSGSAYFNYF